MVILLRSDFRPICWWAERPRGPYLRACSIRLNDAQSSDRSQETEMLSTGNGWRQLNIFIRNVLRTEREKMIPCLRFITLPKLDEHVPKMQCMYALKAIFYIRRLRGLLAFSTCRPKPISMHIRPRTNLVTSWPFLEGLATFKNGKPVKATTKANKGRFDMQPYLIGLWWEGRYWDFEKNIGKTLKSWPLIGSWPLLLKAH